MTDSVEEKLSAEDLQAVVTALLSYLFQNVRQRDGVPAPPLMDRDDFLQYIDLLYEEPSPVRQGRAGLAWLARRMRAYGAQLPGEPPVD